METLIILRDCIMGGKTIYPDGRDTLVLGGVRRKMDTPTSFMVRGRKGVYYPLMSLYLQYTNQDAAFSELSRKCKAYNVRAVGPSDAPLVMQYLTGQSEDAGGRVDKSYKGPDIAADDTAAIPGTAAAVTAPEGAQESATVSGGVDAAKRAFAEHLEALQAKCGCAAAVTDIPDDEAPPADSKGPLDDALPRPAKRRRLPDASTMAPFRDFLDHNVPFTQQILKQEVEGVTFTTLMHTSHRDLLSMFDMLKKQRMAVQDAKNKAAQARRRAVTGTPIIVVPAAPSSIINMFNVKRFLEDGVFVDTAKAKAAARGVKPTKVSVTTKMKGGRQIKFNVIDNVAMLADPRQWEKVVAVFVHGPKWQFKQWLWKEPVEIFAKILGFHLRVDTDQPHPNAEKWRVKHITIGATTRTQDVIAMGEFWRHTLEYVRVKKPHLMTASAQSGAGSAGAGST